MIGRLIREAAAVSAKELSALELLSGTVETASPLSVRVDERFLLTEEHLLLPGYLREKTLSVSGAHSGSVTLQKGLAAGDKLILLAVGSSYLIIGKEEDDHELQLTVT